MFEFHANRNDANKLLDVLERFVNWWFSAPPGEETGVSEERLGLVSLPTPLRRLYSFAGEWPGGTFDSIFSHQDHLAPFEWLQVQDGKLTFAWENQGVWSVATETTGEDPPVYISDDGAPFQLFWGSLSQFLVTFCLHECVFGAPTLSAVDDVDALNKSQGKVPIPLWLDGPYPGPSNERQMLSFYLVDGCILQMNSWCAGRIHHLDERYPEYFPDVASHRPRTTGPAREIWEIPDVPKFIKTRRIEMLIHRHEEISQSHADKALFYRGLLEKIDGET